MPIVLRPAHDCTKSAALDALQKQHLRAEWCADHAVMSPELCRPVYRVQETPKGPDPQTLNPRQVSFRFPIGRAAMVYMDSAQTHMMPAAYLSRSPVS
jgi:hypothetical protein